MRKTVYLDNAATSFPKPSKVIRAVNHLIRHECANPGRSTHGMSLRCAEIVYDTREAIANYLNFDHPEQVVFTHNATHALNMAIKGKIRSKCHIITSDIEHNSVLRPLYKQANEFGAEISVFDSDKPLTESLLPLIRDDTRFIVTTLASNVTGKTIDPIELSKIASERGIYTVIDASQYLGHLPLDLSYTPFDIVCAPGHKALFGLQGGGFSVFRAQEELYTILEGGSGIDTFNRDMPNALPERYEAGTLNMPAIVSLGAGISYINEIGTEVVKERLDALTEHLAEVLIAAGAHIYGCENGIAAFDLPGYDTVRVARHLDECKIATRSGSHCAPLVHKKLGTQEKGVIRASLSIMNTVADVDALYKALRRI